MHDDISTSEENDAPEGANQSRSDALMAIEAGLPPGFSLEGEAICFSGKSEDPLPVCGPLGLVAQAHAPGGHDWTQLFRFMALDGVWRERAVAKRDLSRSLGAVLARFEDQGFAVWDKRRTSDLMRQLRSDDLRETVRDTGWIGSSFTHFVTPSGAVLSTQEASGGFVFTGTPRHSSAMRGTLDEWRAKVVGSNPPRSALIGACVAIAPVTLAHLAHPSFILHLFGNDMAARIARDVACSAWGAPGCLQLSWKDPVRRIVGAIATARDGLVILSGYEPAHAHKLAGVAEALQAHDATAGRVVVLSTGAGAITGGAKRLPVQSDGLVIVDLDTSAWSEDDEGSISRAAGSAYGHFGPAVAEAFINWDSQNSGFLQSRCDDILGRLVGKNLDLADNEMRQAAYALGTLFGAGRMASNRRVWEPGELLPVFAAIAQAWAAGDEDTLSTQDRALIALAAGGIMDLLDATALTPIDGDEASAAGWFDDRWFYLTKAGLRQIAAPDEGKFEVKIPVEKALRVLRAQSLLQPGNEGRSRQYRVSTPGGGRARVYRISRDILRYARLLSSAADAPAVANTPPASNASGAGEAVPRAAP